MKRVNPVIILTSAVWLSFVVTEASGEKRSPAMKSANEKEKWLSLIVSR